METVKCPNCQSQTKPKILYTSDMLIGIICTSCDYDMKAELLEAYGRDI